MYFELVVWSATDVVNNYPLSAKPDAAPPVQRWTMVWSICPIHKQPSHTYLVTTQNKTHAITWRNQSVSTYTRPRSMDGPATCDKTTRIKLTQKVLMSAWHLFELVMLRFQCCLTCIVCMYGALTKRPLPRKEPKDSGTHAQPRLTTHSATKDTQTQSNIKKRRSLWKYSFIKQI